MDRQDLIEKLLNDLGADASDKNIERVEVFVADEKNLKWFDQGNETWEDRLRRAETECNNLRLELEKALRDLGR